MEFFDGELDAAEIIEGLEDAFPLRVRVGKMSTMTGRTGGQIAGAFEVFSPAEGASYAAIPATKGGRNTRRGGIEEGGGIEGVAHVWTLLGSWPRIKAKMLMQIVESETGEVVGTSYEVVSANVHDFGVHTEVLTRAAT